MTPPDPFPTAALLAESAWLHRLALRLVAEPAGAADAAQETLAKALERPPARPVVLRRWLATVLRNVVRQERRGRGRREAREQSVPRVHAVEPTDELAARLELHAALVAAVRALGEPLRTTVALRFLEDLPVGEVARRTGVPEKTVYSRLERALAELRARLDKGYGQRSAWAGLLVPFLPSVPFLEPAPALPTLGAPLAPLLAMSTLWKWSSACAALAAVGFLAVRTLSTPGSRGPAPTHAVGAAAPAELDEPPRALSAAPAAEREARAAAPTSSAPEAAPPPVTGSEPVPTFVGRVLDLERRPVAGLEVFHESVSVQDPAEPVTLSGRARSGTDGSFELPRPAKPCRILAEGRGYATVLAPHLAGPPPPEPPVVFVAPAARYAGRVVDAAGAPIAGAEVGIYLDQGFVRTLRPGTLVPSFALAKGSSDAEGRFALGPVGGCASAHVSAGAPGFRTAKLSLPAESAEGLELVLEPAQDDRPSLAGRVQHRDGRPAAGAWVSHGARAERTDEEGRFELVLEEDSRPERVRAILAGFLPAEQELAGLAEAERHELVLVLGGEALAIHGRVLDGKGEPLAGVQVWTDDGERFGDIERQLGDVSFSLTHALETVIAGADSAQRDGRRTRSDAAGSFALTGMVARRYALWAVDPRTHELAGPLEVAAGSDDVVLTLAGEPRERVAGRVLSYAGTPVAGVGVGVERARTGPDGVVRKHRADDGARVTTDAEGRFEFPSLCVTGTRLVLSSSDAPREAVVELAAEDDLEHLELAFAATCHLRVHLDDPSRATSLELRDERDEPLNVSFQIGGVLCLSSGVQIEGGTSDVLTTDESARTLVLRKGNEESERIPLHLVPGAINELRP
jgi:RNA polymerase sigma-70 factor, ECF subfamily